MRDCLRDFKGSYQDKVTEFFRWTQNKCLDPTHRQQYEFEASKSKTALMDDYDYTNTRTTKRIKATIKYQQEAHKRLQDLISTKEVDGIFAFCNAMILRGGYNAIERNQMITLASAIWILDQLNLQGDLLKAYPHIPQLEEDEILAPYVTHPQYDYELIYGLVKLLRYRNKNEYGNLGMHESTLVSDVVKPGALRSNFDAIVNLLNHSAIDTATKKYEEKIWIQTQYVSHKAFYRIISAIGQKTHLRYFSSKSAHHCAEQLVSAERVT